MIVKYSTHHTNPTVNNTSTEVVNCIICQKALNHKLTKVIAHNSDSGQVHPIHERCIKLWVIHNQSCPSCRAIVDLTSVLSAKDQLKLVSKDAKEGAKISLLAIASIVSSATAIYFILEPMFESEPVFGHTDEEWKFISNFWFKRDALPILISETFLSSACVIKSFFKNNSINLSAVVGGHLGLLTVVTFGDTDTNFSMINAIFSMATGHLVGAATGRALGGWVCRLPFIAVLMRD